MKSKRILVITTEYPPYPGGIGSHAFYLVKELRKLGWEAIVAAEQTTAPDEEINTFNKNLPYKIYRLFPAPSLLLLVRKILFLAWLCIRHRPSVVMGTGKHGSWFAYIVALLTFRKSVLIGHGTEFTITMSDRSKKINRWVYSYCSLLICVSRYTLQAAERVGIKNSTVTVINNGADAEIFRILDKQQIENFRKANKIVDQKVILTVGKISDRKGQEWVIRALPLILQTTRNAHYYCIGNPENKAKFEVIAKELGVENNVHFLGRINDDDLLLWLNSCDISAMTSTHVKGDFEGFGIAVIEAALCGKPAVVTNGSGLAEAIVEGETGLSAGEKDINAIAEKIGQLLTDNELRTQMGKAACNRAASQLTWTIVARQYEQQLLKL